MSITVGAKRNMNQNAFQPALFDSFVRDIGGEVLQESSLGLTADYFFRQECVIAELKCMTADQTESTNAKVGYLIEEWVRKHGQVPPGYRQLNGKAALAFHDAPEEIAAKWGEILRAPIEGLIEKAHRQIRDTKLRLNLPMAKGIVLIFNEANFLHTRVQDFWILCGSVIEKRKRGGRERRFPDLHGMIYFSLDTVPMHDGITGKPMSFWVPGQARTEHSDYLRNFSDVLKERWFTFLANRLGCKINRYARTLDGEPL